MADHETKPMTFGQFDTCVWLIDEHGIIHQRPAPFHTLNKKRKHDFNPDDWKYTIYKRDVLGITDESTEYLTQQEAMQL